MKKNAIGLIFMLLGLTGYTQQKQMEEIKFAVESLRLGMISGNKDLLMQIVSSDLSYGHSSGKVENQKEFVDKLSSGESDFITIDISNQQITLFKNTAIVRHDLSAETNDNGKPGTVKLHILLVWVKEKSGWVLAARQAVKQI